MERSDSTGVKYSANGGTTWYISVAKLIGVNIILPPVSISGRVYSLRISSMGELWKLGIMLVVGLLVAYGGILVSLVLGPRRPNKTKNYPYESGIQIRGDAHGRVAIKYFLVALIFLVFDVEAAVLFPWAVKVGDLKIIAAVEGGIFLLILIVAYLYALGKGAIKWLD